MYFQSEDYLPVILRSGAVSFHDLLLSTWARAADSAVEVEPRAAAGTVGSSAILAKKSVSWSAKCCQVSSLMIVVS